MTLRYPISDLVLELKGQRSWSISAFSHYCSQHNSETKVFKLGIGNDLGISYK